MEKINITKFVNRTFTKRKREFFLRLSLASKRYLVVCSTTPNIRCLMVDTVSAYLLISFDNKIGVHLPVNSKYQNSKHCFSIKVSKIGSVFASITLQTICHVICNFNYKIRSPPSSLRLKCMHIAWLHFIHRNIESIEHSNVECRWQSPHNKGVKSIKKSKVSPQTFQTTRDLPNFISWNFKRRQC